MTYIRETHFLGGEVVLIQDVWFEIDYCNPVHVETIFKKKEQE